VERFRFSGELLRGSLQIVVYRGGYGVCIFEFLLFKNRGTIVYKTKKQHKKNMLLNLPFN
jgi:hypothetical protein